MPRDLASAGSSRCTGCQPGACIDIGGQPVQRLDPALAKSLGIQVIYQDLSLFPNLSVAENIAFDQAMGRWWAPVRRRRQREAAQAVLRRLGIALPLDARVGDQIGRAHV